MLTDKRLLVTGAGAGMGREIAIEAARQGAAVVGIADIDRGAAEDTAAAVKDAGATASVMQVDLSDRGQVHAMVEAAVAAGGGLDTLVNNAGIIDTAFTGTATVEELHED